MAFDDGTKIYRKLIFSKVLSFLFYISSINPCPKIVYFSTLSVIVSFAVGILTVSLMTRPLWPNFAAAVTISVPWWPIFLDYGRFMAFSATTRSFFGAISVLDSALCLRTPRESPVKILRLNLVVFELSSYDNVEFVRIFWSEMTGSTIKILLLGPSSIAVLSPVAVTYWRSYLVKKESLSTFWTLYLGSGISRVPSRVSYGRWVSASTQIEEFKKYANEVLDGAVVVMLCLNALFLVVWGARRVEVCVV